MNTKLIKYTFAICCKEGIYDVFEYNRFVINKKFAYKKEDRLDLPKVDYIDNKEEFKELEKMLNEYHANKQLKLLIKQTGWFKSTMYLVLLKLGNWLRLDKNEKV